MGAVKPKTRHILSRIKPIVRSQSVDKEGEVPSFHCRQVYSRDGGFFDHHEFSSSFPGRRENFELLQRGSTIICHVQQAHNIFFLALGICLLLSCDFFCTL